MQVRLFITQAADSFRFINQSVKEQLHRIEHLIIGNTAYNKVIIRRTLESGYTWFWSRSRQALWNKGATSGHLQKVVAMYSDCDNDTLLVQVEQTGAACHTGHHSCFYTKMEGNFNDCD